MAKTKKESAAEKQRRYRQKRDANPARRAEYLKKEKEAWIRKKENGKTKRIADLSDRSQRSRRKSWREAQARKRERDRSLRDNLTPPSRPLALPLSQ